MSGRKSRKNAAALAWVLREGLSEKMTAMLMLTDKEPSYKDQEEEHSRRIEQHVQKLKDRNKLGQYENRKKHW